MITNTSELHHLNHVLRLKEGSVVEFFNGKNRSGEGTIIQLSAKECQIKVDRLFDHKPDVLYLTLACALPKKSKFETIIEKATELGINEVIPLKTHRTEVTFKGERAIKKQARFETVALNAAKQCKRADIPLIQPVSNLKDCLQCLKNDTLLIMPGLIEPRKKIGALFPLDKNVSKVAVFIGPEGDFTKDEYTVAINQGAHIVSLGEHTLKVETAALAAISFIQLNAQS